MFLKFDTDNTDRLELDEFVNLCNWVDPRWDKATCIRKYTEIDNDKSKTIDKTEFFKFAKMHFVTIIKTEIENIMVKK